MGYFGKIFGKFAPAHLMEYFLDYSNEVWEARADYYGKKKPEEPKIDDTPLTPEEQVRQDEYFKSLTELAKKLSSNNSDQRTKESEERDERIRKHVDFFQKNLTPDQKKEIETRRQEIQDAAKRYEKEQNQ